MYYVNEYSVNREYGGPEEGGWYYNTGRFLRCHGVFKNREDAETMVDGLASYLDEQHEYESVPGSVLCTGYTEIYIQDHPGESFPQERPYYS